MSFFLLPLEIRLTVYEELFGMGIASINGGRQDTGSEAQTPSMLPIVTGQGRSQQRSAQMLRTCKTILAEASPVLYKNTIFRSTFQAFAGRLPVQLTAGHPSAPKVRHLDWELKCDLLKKYDPAELDISREDIQSLQSVQLVCQAASWREPIYGERCDRENLAHGRGQVIDFAKALQQNMRRGTKIVTLLEDTSTLSRGRVVLKILEGWRALADHVSILSEHYRELYTHI